MLTQLYSIRPIPASFRTTFQLPDDPYMHPTPESVIAYLTNLGIFFYRDEDYAHGIILDVDGQDVAQMKNFVAFKTLVNLDSEEYTPLDFDASDREMDKRLKKHGDTKMWLVFNQEKRIRKVTENAVNSV